MIALWRKISNWWYSFDNELDTEIEDIIEYCKN